MKSLLAAAGIAALVAFSSACNREGQAREENNMYRSDTTTVQPVTPPADTSMMRDSLSDTMRRDTVPARRP